MYFVYIIKCIDSSIYIGYTKNIKERIKKHNDGLSFSTKCRLPVKLIWLGTFVNENKAISFEKYLKSGSGRAFLNKRLI